MPIALASGMARSKQFPQVVFHQSLTQPSLRVNASIAALNVRESSGGLLR
jgi:hypothetical protein